MTITTAKRPAALPRLAPLAAALLVALPAHADWRVTPTVAVTETWTDNVNLQSEALAESELVTQITPGVSVVRTGRRLNLAASAQWHQFAYLHDNGRNTRDSQRSYSGTLKSILADDLLYLDASANRGQRSLSAFGPQLSNDLYALGNRSEISTWSISPYLLHRFGSTATMQVRYTVDSVDSGRTAGFDKTDGNSLSANLVSGASFSTIGWGLAYQRQDLDSTRQGDSSTETLSGNLRYRLTPRLALTATAGYDRYDFGSFGGTNAGRNWSVGFDWNPSLRTSLQASIGRHYYGQTGALAASHRSRYTVWAINYSDSITTSRQQFLLPSTIDTAALLDRLFSAAYPDPVERQRIVQIYMQATGLPPSLADNVNYLTNRYLRQKLLQASGAYRRGRSSVVLGLYASDRNALSDQRSDSELLGGQLATLNTNVRQRGASLNYSYLINSRSTMNASWGLSRSHSIITGIEDRQRTLRVGATRRYGQRLLGTVEVRRRSGDVSIGGNGTYREHAVAASLSMQL